MIDASNDNGRYSITPSHDVTDQDKEASTAPKPTAGNPPDPTECETVESQSATAVSSKKVEANRRNAQRSTGPRSEAGKAVSRLNAMKHGLLARGVVIAVGDYQEDGEEYAGLLDELTEQLQPEGIIEALEVQKIALAYWRKARAVRCEHGAIRARTGDMRLREERKRQEAIDNALNFGWSLERTAGGLQWLIEFLENVKQEVLHGQVQRESLDWLSEHFPDEFSIPDNVAVNAEGLVVGPPQYLHELAIRIPRKLQGLYPLRKTAAQAEELQLESKILAAAIPPGAVVDKLARYETSIERELDRALERLERMQKRRRENGRVSGAEPESA